MYSSTHEDADECSAVGAQSIELADVKKATVSVAMLSRVAQSEAHFKHQQRGEPDLSTEEKLQIATQILEKNPATFLARFGRHLNLEDLEYFDHVKDQYEIKYHLKEITKFLDDKKNETKKRNRRFEAMKKMMDKGEYFSAELMKERDPLLYEQLIGQYQTQEEIEGEVSGRDLNFSSVLIEHVQALANAKLYTEIKDREDGQLEESESEEEDMSDEENEEGISGVEKQMLKNEFLRTMQLRFLNGEDNDFDYRAVDENEEFDSLDIREHDEEEKYFDDDDDYFDDVSDDVIVPQPPSVKHHNDSNTCNPDRKSDALTEGNNQSNAEKLSNLSAERVSNMECDSGSRQDSEVEEDYTDYMVKTDVCPGLNKEEQPGNIIKVKTSDKLLNSQDKVT